MTRRALSFLGGVAFVLLMVGVPMMVWGADQAEPNISQHQACPDCLVMTVPFVPPKP